MKSFPSFTYIILGIFVIFSISYSSLLHAKPSSINMVALGDSITYGTGDPQKKGYIKRFKEQFEQFNGTTINISNFGVPKYTTNQLLVQLKDREVKKAIQHSDYILLYIGTNDFRKSAQYTFDQINLDKIIAGKHDFAKRLQNILEIIRKENSSSFIIVMGLYHPYVEYQNQQQLLEIIHDWNGAISNVVSHFENTRFVPTLDLFVNHPKKDYFSDSLHLNANGYQLMANRLFQKMPNIDYQFEK